jgi:hypothetical protein
MDRRSVGAGVSWRKSRRYQEHRDAGRLVLAVAVHRHQHLVLLLDGEPERADDRRPVSAVGRVGDAEQLRLGVEQLRGVVGGPVVHDEDARRVPPGLGEDRGDVPGLVVHRDGGEPAEGVHAGRLCVRVKGL